MRVCIDIEADALVNPKNIWLIVAKDIDTGLFHIFRNVTEDEEERQRWVLFVGGVSTWIGHNILGYDIPVLKSLLDFDDTGIAERCTDTLILSKLIDYSRQGHSIEDYGLEFNTPKGKFVDFSKYSQEMEDYCVRDVDICHRIYDKYHRYISNPGHRSSIELEHRFQQVVNSLHDNGFSFNSSKANSLLSKVEAELTILDKDILEAFPPRLKLIREITPKETKYGTLSKSDFRWLGTGDLSDYNGGPFCRCSWTPFNPSSHRQIVQVLADAGWVPVDKTQSHIDTEREIARLRYKRGDKELDIIRKELIVKLDELKKTGWKVNEQNVNSLPEHEPIELWKRKCQLKISHEDCSGLEIITNAIKNLSNQKQESITIKIPELIKTDSSSGIMELILRNLKDCTQNNPDYVRFAENQKHLWWITVTLQAVYVDCSASFATDTWVGLRNKSSLQENILKLKAARLLAKRILLESRRRTLTEWIGLCTNDSRIHGKFYGLGAWTHRMAHQSPNTANIPNEYDTQGKKKLLGKELRSLWCAPKNRLLVGVDAEGMQLRIFAHLINDPEFTKALVEGKKDDKTDPHSLNQSILGSVCRSRAAAKRFIFALLLGAGIGKLSEILGCSNSEAQEALDRLMGRYTGWQKLKEEVFPLDAKRGWFTGLDGRRVRIPGEDVGSRRHLAMSGYLQNGEAVVMKMATLEWVDKLKEYDALLVNLIHDEWQVEAPNNMTQCIAIASMMAGSLKSVGDRLKLNCPLAGSYWNEDNHDYTIHTNWSKTH